MFNYKDFSNNQLYLKISDNSLLQRLRTKIKNPVFMKMIIDGK